MLEAPICCGMRRMQSLYKKIFLILVYSVVWAHFSNGQLCWAPFIRVFVSPHSVGDVYGIEKAIIKLALKVQTT